MKKTVNKILCLALACVMAFALLPVIPAFAQGGSGVTESGDCSKTMHWTLDENGTLTVSGTGEMPRFGFYSDYTPGRVDYINAPWKGVNDVNTNIKRVVIEEGVESISDYAFYGYYTITEVTIPSTVTDIGQCAFYGCTGLKNVFIPETVKSIGYGAFRESGLQSVTVGNPDVTFGDSVFYQCTKLAQVNFAEGTSGYSKGILSSTAWYNAQPNGVIYLSGVVYGYKGTMQENTELVLPEGTKGIADRAFASCGNLVSVTIPDSVTRIGAGAFEGCAKLAQINIPDSVTQIGAGAFLATAWYNAQPNGLVYAGKTAYKYKGVMPNGTDTVLADDTLAIADECFSDCTGLASVSIPDGVIRIGKSAFSGCKTLAQTDIPSGVTDIGDYAFKGCLGLTAIHIPGSATSVSGSAFSDCSGIAAITADENNAVYHAEGNCLIETAANKLVAGCKNSVIPADGSVTAIGACAFKGCGTITSLTLPDGIVSIGNDAFSGCMSLTGLTLPDSVAVIGMRAFSKCSAFTECTVPDGITIINNSMFSQCTKLKDITIPDSVRTIDGDAFNGCMRLKSISIPDSVTMIGSYAFKGSGVNNVVIPNSVTHIGNNAFENCSGLTDITLSDHLLYIANSTFYCCKLQDLVIPDSVTGIDYRAFYRNANLKNIHFGKNTGYISPEAFEDCYRIETITADPRNTVYRAEGNCLIYLDHYLVLGCKNSVIPDDGSIQRIQKMAFYHCTDLTAIRIPEGVGYIDEQAFEGCTKLAQVTLPESMVRIWCNAFKDCTALTEMTFPDSVSILGYEAFIGCSNLTTITLSNNVTSNAGAFKDCRNLTDVYYYGNEADWNTFLASTSAAISNLRNATVHYLERTQQSEPTATEHGYTAGVYCHTCEEWYAGHEVIHNALGEVTLIQAPTATQPGVYSAVCTVCGNAFLYEHPLTEHIPGEAVVENEIAPTCTEDGGYDLATYCAVCGGEIGREHVHEPALGHSFTSTVTTPPTCTEPGVRTYECERCHETYTEEEPASGHGLLGYSVSSAPSTCVVRGYSMTVCIACGEITDYEVYELDPDNHNWGEWTLVTPPTYLSEGLEQRTCGWCGETQTNVIPALIPEITIGDPDTGIELQLQQGVLPENTVFTVDEEFDGTYFLLLNRDVANIGSTLYNITPTSDGQTVQPDGYVLVRLPIPAGYNPDTLCIYYISTETSSTERMDCYIEDGYICFQTTHFSVYAIVDTSVSAETEPPTQPTTENNDSGSFFTRLIDWFRGIIDWFKKLFNK